MTDTEQMSESAEAEEETQIDPIDAITELFDEMKPHKAAMFSILTLCKQEQSASAIAEHVNAIQGTHAVFSPANLCRILEGAGAVQRLCALEDEEGASGESEGASPEAVEQNVPTLIPASEAPVREAVEVVEGDTTYIQALPQRESLWLTTGAGHAFLDAQDAYGDIVKLPQDESDWWPIYLELFEFLSNDEGHTQSDVAKYITVLPSFVEVNDKLSTTHMLDQAQLAGAIIWKDGWRLTDAGRAFLNAQ